VQKQQTTTRIEYPNNIMK